MCVNKIAKINILFIHNKINRFVGKKAFYCACQKSGLPAL